MVKFGVFDHIDRNGAALESQYEDRLRIIEAYDAAGFDSYHLAEHHGTPLGMAPSPGIFLASVAQRTRRIRFGPLVYILPLYHPLRLAEEVVMLDRLSNGRLNLGIGRGISPIESSLYGNDPADGQARFDETLAVLRLAFTEQRLNFAGRFYQFDDVPIEMHPIQQPHPPFWYGVGSAESAERAATRGFNGVTHNVGEAADVVTRFRTAAAAAGRPELEIGLTRFVLVADTDAEALAIARRAYPIWSESFHHLYHAHGRSPVWGERPDFEGTRAKGHAIVGSPATVLAELAEQTEASGTDMQLGQFVFGDMTIAESLQSIGLFAAHVMPALQKTATITSA
ncbi:MAG TPA: LLM class flavin-dependent oxidoreductase [Candidatus Lustribacter sp.]|jgi:alkanesulfonate monooxygenase SsuD/methylene tetrahydromethanopterin reductase-like flavin-dependent oxidoreductase (luciferase family)|nr:LLM class flavin-dependent oxidoreductase [Candidatus Lustribacter sp.]